MRAVVMFAWLLAAPALAAAPLALAAADTAAKAAVPPAPAAIATAAKTTVTVGEPFSVEVRATGPAGSAFTFPAEIVEDGFELRAAPADSGVALPGVQRYQASAFALEDVRVPAIPVGYRLPDGTSGEVSTAPIPLEVVSLLPKDQEEQKLADVRSPVALPIGRAFWVGVAALAVLAALAIWLVMRRRRKPAPLAAPVPALAPDEDARQALDHLVASGRLARGEYRPFYIELTAIVKRYLERRLDAPIVEMTTAEMLVHLRSTPLGVDLAPTLRDLTGAADQIKFARGSGLTEEAERHLAASRALIAEVETRMKPAVPAGGQAA